MLLILIYHKLSIFSTIKNGLGLAGIAKTMAMKKGERAPAQEK